VPFEQDVPVPRKTNSPHPLLPFSHACYAILAHVAAMKWR